MGQLDSNHFSASNWITRFYVKPLQFWDYMWSLEWDRSSGWFEISGLFYHLFSVFWCITRLNPLDPLSQNLVWSRLCCINYTVLERFSSKKYTFEILKSRTKKKERRRSETSSRDYCLCLISSEALISCLIVADVSLDCSWAWRRKFLLKGMVPCFHATKLFQTR